MIDRGVWRNIDRKNILNNRRLIGNKWVFKIKRDGTYRARLVALGYSQIPGVDYTDNFAPVAHDVSFRIAMAWMMVKKLDSLVMDVETAFLYGDIEEEIFMKSPIGMEEIDPGSSPEDCYQLKKGIYGLCQAARQFWKKFVDTIKQESFGFQVRPVDVSFRIALARMMVKKLDSLVMDVETAFLYGDIEEEIFMKSPIGMEEIDPGSSPEDCYQLKKGIYGLCQAARQFWKKFVDTIKQESFGFQVRPADPCMLFKENELGICIIIMYIDDMLIIGNKEQIEDFASKIKEVFSVKIHHNLADYLGCEFHMNKERTRGWLGQPSIIKSLEQKLGEREQ